MMIRLRHPVDYYSSTEASGCNDVGQMNQTCKVL